MIVIAVKRKMVLISMPQQLMARGRGRSFPMFELRGPAAVVTRTWEKI